jgi:hypothetical protein
VFVPPPGPDTATARDIAGRHGGQVVDASAAGAVRQPSSAE